MQPQRLAQPGAILRRRRFAFFDRFEEPGVGSTPDLSEAIEVFGVDRLLHTEVGGVVDRRLHPHTVEVLEVRLGLGRPVVDLNVKIQLRLSLLEQDGFTHLTSFNYSKGTQLPEP
jgi:hypothetical protein